MYYIVKQIVPKYRTFFRLDFSPLKNKKRDMKNIDIAERLKELMDSSPLSRSEYARRMGMPRNTFSARLQCDPKWVDMIFQLYAITA